MTGLTDSGRCTRPSGVHKFVSGACGTCGAPEPARPLPNRTRVVCVEHNGQHEGLIVHDLGFAYGVAWDFINKPENRVHAKDATHTAYDAVREVVECPRCGANLAADDHVRGHQTSKENDR